MPIAIRSSLSVKVKVITASIVLQQAGVRNGCSRPVASVQELGSFGKSFTIRHARQLCDHAPSKMQHDGTALEASVRALCLMPMLASYCVLQMLAACGLQADTREAF